MSPNEPCMRFRESLFEFQADELSAAEREAFQNHLDVCEDCARRLEVEDGLLSGLRQRLAAVEAPPGLETRIRASLDEQAAPKRSAFGWLRSPWVAAAAASVLLLAVLVPGLGLSPGLPAPLAGPIPYEGEVMVVDHDCDRAGRTLAQQRRCSHPLHVNVLKKGNGDYVHLSAENVDGRRLTLTPELRGHRVSVAGTYHPKLAMLQVSGFDDLGANEL